MDVCDIPISEITQQYMGYLKVIEMLDLDYAGEFILMAATLIRIKAKMLLPKPELDEEEEEDPRQELVQRLLEYQRYKEVADEFSNLERDRRNFFPAQNYAFHEEEVVEEEGIPIKDVSMFDLMAVFMDVVRRIPPVTEHTVEQIPVTIEDQAHFVLSLLETKDQVLFKDLLLSQVKEKIILIVTFIAILELVRSNKVFLNQNQPFSEIWIRKN